LEEVELVLLPVAAGAEAVVAAVEPCDPAPAITPHAIAKLARLVAATVRRMRAIRPARARRSRSPRALADALVFDMEAT
jgi:hypothetical protein